ncbi:MAG: tetratricopeptide repeat protein [Acidobacteriota bacterium]
MNIFHRESALSLLAGVLIGFVAAYFLFESIAERQPARIPMEAAVSAQAGGQAGGAPDGQPVEGPFMAQVRRLEERLRANPDDADAVHELSNLYFDAQAWDFAEQGYVRYLQLRPDDPDVLTELGVTLYNQGRFEESLARFDRAQELSPDHWESLFNRTVVLAFGMARWDDAEEMMDRLRTLRPDSPEVERLATGIEERKTAS